MTSPDLTASAHWWLKLQIGLASAGGLIWLAGAMLENDFASGVGLGLIVAALVLRIGRRTADASETASDPADAASDPVDAHRDT